MVDSKTKTDLTEVVLLFEGISRSSEVKSFMDSKSIWIFRESISKIKEVNSIIPKEKSEEKIIPMLEKLCKWIESKSPESEKMNKLAVFSRNFLDHDVKDLIKNQINRDQKGYDSCWIKIDENLKEAGFKQKSLELQELAIKLMSPEKSFVSKMQLDKGTRSH